MRGGEKSFSEKIRKTLSEWTPNKNTTPVLFILTSQTEEVGLHPLSPCTWEEPLWIWAQRMGISLHTALYENECHILFESDSKAHNMDTLASTLLKGFHHWFHHSSGQKERKVHFSLGVAMAISSSLSEDALEEMAYIALERAQKVRRSAYRIFNFTPDDLKRALLHDEFIVFYQPQYSLDGALFMGVEALVRWQHPRYGMILPTHFIPIAEHSGVIIELGAWVLQQACIQGRQWDSLRIGVNVSPQQVVDDAFFLCLKNTLHITHMDPRRLELELTEEGRIPSFSALRGRMEDIRALGVRFALDDFGEGRGGLQELKRLHFDTLKIPYSLVEGIEKDTRGAILVRGLIRLGRELALDLIVEGIETPEQKEVLESMGDVWVQGFLYGKPMPVADIDRLLASYAMSP
jgi:EAL domain-containing protein (putative c-di-GMP-specific phosphodiesterase class I)